MSAHIYAFGSVCRGEVDPASDIDLLACLGQPDPKFDPEIFSIYSFERIKELWKEGNPFAWHLHLESKLIYSSDGSDFLKGLKKPSPYTKSSEDCMKFSRLFHESYHSLLQSSNSVVFHLSCMFLAARNFATCHSLGVGKPVFSRLSPMLIENELPIEEDIFDIFSRARILSTRGYGSIILKSEAVKARSSAPVILDWMESIVPSGNTQ